MKNKAKAKSVARDVAHKIAEGIIAGILISLGGGVYLACIDPQVLAVTPYVRYIGALLFCLALICICMRGYALYTGKIGLIFEKHKKEDISLLLLCLLGNAIGTIACGYLLAWIFPSIKETALTLCTGKLDQGYLFGLLRAVFCGLLVYLSIDIWLHHKTIVGVVFCIPAFILSGYEHSIADMFYFAVSGIASFKAFGYLAMIVIGNSLGALVIPALRLLKPKKEPTEAKDETPTEKKEEN